MASARLLINKFKTNNDYERPINHSSLIREFENKIPDAEKLKRMFATMSYILESFEKQKVIINSFAIFLVS